MSEPRETDALWYGRELERHAKRAGDAVARFERAREALEGLAASWEEYARERNAAADDAIPFGDGALTEDDAAALRDEAGYFLEAAEELRTLLAGL